jgi:predicted ATPase
MKPAHFLIGRKDELVQVLGYIQAALAGEPRAALLSGEPGSGKTSLLQAAAVLAEREGALVLQAGLERSDGTAPFQPFMDAFDGYLDALPITELHGLVGERAESLERIFPGLLERLEILPDEDDHGFEADRLVLFDAVRRLLAGIAASRPVALLLDDIHAWDVSSLVLLAHLVGDLPPARLLVIAACRAEGTGSPPAHPEELRQVTGLPAWVEIPVNRLSASETAEFAASYLEASLPDEAARALYEGSRGNPFIAEALLDDWQELGLLDARSPGEFAAPPPLDLAAGIFAAIRQRASRLPEESLELLRAAALTGCDFRVSFLGKVLSLKSRQVEESLNAALRARILLPQKSGGMCFRHPLIREYLEKDVTPVLRRRLHAAIGLAMEKERQPHPTRFTAMQRGAHSVRRQAEMAFHFLRSGDHERGAKYGLQAAGQALHAAAAPEAAALYQSVLEMLYEQDHRRGEVLLRLGEAREASGPVEGAIPLYEAAQEWFLQSEETERAALAGRRLAQAYRRQAMHHHSLQALQQALAVVNCSLCPERVHILIDLAHLLAGVLDRAEEGIAVARQALELSRDMEDTRLMASSTHTLETLLAGSLS